MYFPKEEQQGVLGYYKDMNHVFSGLLKVALDTYYHAGRRRSKGGRHYVG